MARTLLRVAIGSAAAVWLCRITGEMASRRRMDLGKRGVYEALIAGGKSPSTPPSNQTYFDALRARVESAKRVRGTHETAIQEERRNGKSRSIVELAGSVESPVRGGSIEEMNPWHQGPSVAWLFRLAKYVWDDASDAWAWMTTPHSQLSGKMPIDAATTHVGAERVEEILWRIFYGIPP
jgi:hypothetical protein